MNDKLLIKKLRKAIELKSEEAIEELVQKIGLTKVVEAVPYLITLLNETDNCCLRNLVALALADIKDQRALEPLLSLIKSKRTERCRGTLVYALQSLDCASILIDLVDLVINGGFEVSCEAFYAIESIRTPHSSKEVQLGCQKIETAINSEPSFDQDKIERLKLLKHLLESNSD